MLHLADIQFVYTFVELMLELTHSRMLSIGSSYSPYRCVYPSKRTYVYIQQMQNEGLIRNLNLVKFLNMKRNRCVGGYIDIRLEILI